MAFAESTVEKECRNIENASSTKRRRYNNLQYVFLILILLLILMVSVITLIIFLTKYSPRDDKQVQAKPNITHIVDSVNNSDTPTVDPNVDIPEKLKIISQQEWLAQPFQEQPLPLPNPVPYVIILDTATEDCSNQGSCAFHMRFLQSFHIDSRGRTDIAYNFLLGGDGYAYEGRGWQAQGAHTLNYNSRSIGIAFMGTFINEAPPERQIIAAKQLIHLGVEKGFIAKNFKLFGARQLDNVKTPGEKLMEEIKTWPHWAEKP